MTTESAESCDLDLDLGEDIAFDAENIDVDGGIFDSDPLGVPEIPPDYPEAWKGPLEASLATSPMKVIRARCLDCAAGSAKEVRFWCEEERLWRVELRRAHNLHTKVMVPDGQRCPVLAFALVETERAR